MRRCPSVRPSVCLSHVGIVHVKTAKLIIKLFTLPDSHTSLVFQSQTLWQYSDGDPPHRGVECKEREQYLHTPHH